MLFRVRYVTCNIPYMWRPALLEPLYLEKSTQQGFNSYVHRQEVVMITVYATCWDRKHAGQRAAGTAAMSPTPIHPASYVWLGAENQKHSDCPPIIVIFPDGVKLVLLDCQHILLLKHAGCGVAFQMT